MWVEIQFVRGYSEFRAAWQNNSVMFLAPGEEMRLGAHSALTNMPAKHVRRFLRECAPNVRVNLFETDLPES